MQKGGGYNGSNPLARMLDDKRAASNARAKLVERLKQDATPIVTASVPETKAPAIEEPAVPTIGKRIRIDGHLLSSTASERFSGLRASEGFVAPDASARSWKPDPQVLHKSLPGLGGPRKISDWGMAATLADRSPVYRPIADPIADDRQTKHVPNLLATATLPSSLSARRRDARNDGIQDEALLADEPTSRSLDIDKANSALLALSKRGFDRVRGWREVDAAFKFVKSRGYAGPKQDARQYLKGLIELRQAETPIVSGQSLDETAARKERQANEATARRLEAALGLQGAQERSHSAEHIERADQPIPGPDEAAPDTVFGRSSDEVGGLLDRQADDATAERLEAALGLHQTQTESSDRSEIAESIERPDDDAGMNAPVSVLSSSGDEDGGMPTGALLSDILTGSSLATSLGPTALRSLFAGLTVSDYLDDQKVIEDRIESLPPFLRRENAVTDTHAFLEGVLELSFAIRRLAVNPADESTTSLEEMTETIAPESADQDDGRGEAEDDALSTPSAVGAHTVADLLAQVRLSERLSNVVRANAMFGRWTISSALERRDEFREQLFKLRNAGRKTVNEVLDLLDRYASGPGTASLNAEEPWEGQEPSVSRQVRLTELLRDSPLTASLGSGLLESMLGNLTVGDCLTNRGLVSKRLGRLPSRPRRERAIAEINELLDRIGTSITLRQPVADKGQSTPRPAWYDHSIVDILDQHDLSTRLRSVLTTDAVKALNVGGFILDRLDFERAVRGIRNSGQTTLDEMVRILSEHIEKMRRIDEAGGPTPVSAEAHGSPTDDANDADISPRERLLKILGALPEKELLVLRARYGLENQDARTLQDIAVEVNRTRERVRQVEKKALRRLQKGPARAALAAFIGHEKERQWAILVGDGVMVLGEALSQRSKLLDPLFALAVDAAFGGVKNWIAGFAHWQVDGWARDAAVAVLRTTTIEQIERVIRDFPMPMPLESVRREIVGDLDISSLSGLVVKDGTIFEGYLCGGYMGANAKRGVRLHQLAKEIAQAGLFDVGTLVRTYRTRYPDDDAGSRVLLKQMERIPHLLASVFDGIWMVLPATSRATLEAPLFERGEVRKEAEFGETSAGGRILKYLEDNGPQRISDIAEHVKADDDASSGSVGATLATNPCFRRVAPGVYGLYTDDRTMRKQLGSTLLNESHCRIYCLARHSGAPPDYYPGWGVEFEIILLQWARTSAPSDLYRSLLSVIEPLKWGIPAELATQMQSIKINQSRWSIGSERRYDLGHRFIDPEQFLSIVAHLAVFGWIGWFAVNRICGGLSTQTDAADVLAFLVLAGLVEPRADWQDRYPATAKAAQVFQAAGERMHRTGKLAWDDPVLSPILEGVETPRQALGWIEAEEVEAAIAGWRSGQLSTGRAYGGGGGAAAPVDIEETFNSAGWGNIFAV